MFCYPWLSNETTWKDFKSENGTVTRFILPEQLLLGITVTPLMSDD